MAGHYLFACPLCGGDNSLTLKQAGQDLDCEQCSQPIQAPKLGDIRKLPGVEESCSTAASGKASRSGSSRQSGVRSPLQGWLFAGGLTLAVLAGIAGWQLQSYANSLKNDFSIQQQGDGLADHLETQPPAAIYEIAKTAGEDHAIEYEEPTYKRNNKQSEILTRFAYGLWALCGTGILMLIGSFLAKPA